MLKSIRENASNRFCADCGRSDPEWAVVNWGLVVCKDCSGVHRDLGVSYSKVRSLKMDEEIWTEDVVTFMQQFGEWFTNTRLYKRFSDRFSGRSVGPLVTFRGFLLLLSPLRLRLPCIRPCLLDYNLRVHIDIVWRGTSGVDLWVISFHLFISWIISHWEQGMKKEIKYGRRNLRLKSTLPPPIKSGKSS